MGGSDEVVFGDDLWGVRACRYPHYIEVYVCEYGAGTAQFHMTTHEASELRDALDRWINEGGK